MIEQWVDILLLAFLAVEGHQGQPCAELASRLWPAVSELEGRNHLRGALEELTRILGPAADCLVIDSQQVALPSAGADHYVDTRHLEEAAAWLAEGYDLESLLVAWLNSLLTQADIQELIFCRFEPRIQGLQLTGWAYGQEYSQDPELQGVEVKGATFNELLVQAQQGLWLAQCVVDV